MIKTKYIEEPSLQFGTDQHICPRQGLYAFSPYDLENLTRPEKIKLGLIGKSESIEIVLEWLENCKSHIDQKQSNNPNLFLNFCGFNDKVGFKSEITYDNSLLRNINNSEYNEIVRDNEDLGNRITKIADLYLNEIKYLSDNKKPDVILCILSNKFLTSVTEGKNIMEQSDSEVDEIDHFEEKNGSIELEQNFRRYLKAKAMRYKIPIQLMRDKIVSPNSTMQDPATIAWNFFTAIYYKASGTPWALVRKDISEATCYAGVSFYRSRDKQSIQTSMAQIFNELGKGVILRGEEVRTSKNDLTPHLTEEQAFSLLSQSLKEYYNAIKIYPKRLVLHKTSNFSPDEIYGFKQAAKQSNIFQIDLVTIQPTPIRLYRTGQYPPLRGTQAQLSEEKYLLYTRGSVPHYETYSGMYIPSPLEIRLFENDESPDVICEEILGLTKMNWNNTQFDRKYPITVECARNVGQILKYLDNEDPMELKYSFYM